MVSFLDFLAGSRFGGVKTGKINIKSTVISLFGESTIKSPGTERFGAFLATGG